MKHIFKICGQKERRRKRKRGEGKKERKTQREEKEEQHEEWKKGAVVAQSDFFSGSQVQKAKTKTNKQTETSVV